MVPFAGLFGLLETLPECFVARTVVGVSVAIPLVTSIVGFAALVDAVNGRAAPVFLSAPVPIFFFVRSEQNVGGEVEPVDF